MTTVPATAPPEITAKAPRAAKGTSRRRGLPVRESDVAAVPLAAVASPTGESYGEEGWREEELSAGELEVDAPELQALEEEIGGPDVGGESEEDGEW